MERLNARNEFYRETFLLEVQMQVKEEIIIDGHKVTLIYAEESKPGVMDNIKKILMNQRDLSYISPQICSKSKKVK